MNERLLQFIWQHQYFNTNELLTTEGDTIHILHPGHYNKNQGPDFSDARIRIGNTLMAGTVELHVFTSHWVQHGHSEDDNYGNVVLHVVWQNDLESGGPSIPMLVLEPRIPASLLQQYKDWLDKGSFIPCEKQWQTAPFPDWKQWKERLLEKRMLRKEERIQKFLEECNLHWEESFWWLLARHLGDPVNADSFEAVARSLPLKILARHRNQIHQLEALLLGQAGLLQEDFEEAYPSLLKKEYTFLAKKYKLKPVPWPVLFLRMRPGNFPTIRLAQVAILLHTAGSLFTQLRDCETIAEIKALLDITANDYWHYHYRFGEPGKFSIKKLGEEMIRSIIINVICPILITYSKHNDEPAYSQKAFQWLEMLPAENNSIVRKFESIGAHARSAADTQALLELKSQYCDHRHCLDCAIGNFLLNKDWAIQIKE